MVVSHNMQAMNSNRILQISVDGVGKSAEKLSSGYRVNRAADDAAGLAISEKMRAQIRGLDRASKNALDGISLIQTAEGGLNEVHSMLQRMNELCVQGANDTNTPEDRHQIQMEIDQLKVEIDNISEKTTFNTKHILMGLNTYDTGGTIGANLPGEENKLTYYTAKDQLAKSIQTVNYDENTGVLDAPLNTVNYLNAFIMGVVPPYGDPDIANNTDVEYMGIEFKGPNDADYKGIQAIISTSPADPSMPYYSGHEIVEALHASGRDDPRLADYANGFKDSLNDVFNYIRNNYPDDVRSAEVVKKNGIPNLEIQTWSDVNENLKLNLQVGSLSGQKIELDLSHMNVRRLGIGGVGVDNYEVAGKGMKAVQDALDIVSTERAKLGAQQNRLEHTIANLDNTSENTQAAESRIRDTDMALEMTRYAKHNILTQTGQAMLAQANQSNQGVLALLG